MQFSHSRVETFKDCPYKFKLRYISKVETLDEYDPVSPLKLGTALHNAIEKGAEQAIQEYFYSYPIIEDRHIDESIKIEILAETVRQALNNNCEFEKRLNTNDFVGFIDYVEELPDGTYLLCDFKYTNNVENYRDSPQLHLYKYFFEKLTGKQVSQLAYIFIPKVNIKRERNEPITKYRQRIAEVAREIKPLTLNVTYDPNKVIQWYHDVKNIIESTHYPKLGSYCYFCEYRDYCEKGETLMLLPENKRRNNQGVTKKTVWIYGAPFSGKTFFANEFPDPLMLNTDGNIKFIDAPYIHIKNQVTTEGRLVKTKQAWEVFKEVVDELEKQDNTFKTIVVDLLEDLYQACRMYMYKKMNIEHESDDNFRAWDKVRQEFLSTIKRLMNLDYENIILISHEDLSKDITKRSGDKITAIRPALAEKVANKIAGMVDIVARVVANDTERTLVFKSSDVVFGGGRLTVQNTEIPLDYNEFLKIYNTTAVEEEQPVGRRQRRRRE